MLRRLLCGVHILIGFGIYTSASASSTAPPLPGSTAADSGVHNGKTLVLGDEEEGSWAAAQGQPSPWASLPLGTKRPYFPLADVLTAPRQTPHAPTSGSGNDTSRGQATYVAMLTRHGARLPTRGKMKLVTDLATKVCAAAAAVSDTAAADNRDTNEVSANAKEWCTAALQTAADAFPGDLTERGADEMVALGTQMTSRYVYSDQPSVSSASNRGQGDGEEAVGADERRSSTAAREASVSIVTSSSRRCGQSCRALLAGTAAAGMPLPLDTPDPCANVNDTLLRPYKTCSLQQHVRKVLLPRLLDEQMIEESLATLSRATGLSRASLTQSDSVAAFYACQMDVARTTNDTEALGGGEAGWVGDGVFACSMMDARVMGHLSVEEDMENYLTRGFGKLDVTRLVMLPLLHHITRGITGRAEEEDAPAPRNGLHMDLLFSHDSAVLPFASLLGLLDLGTDAAQSNAAKFCPFSSRLVVEVLPCGAVQVWLNDFLARRFADSGAWLEAYADLLSVSWADTCAEAPPWLWDAEETHGGEACETAAAASAAGVGQCAGLEQTGCEAHLDIDVDLDLDIVSHL